MAAPRGPASIVPRFARLPASRLALILATAAAGGGVALWEARQRPRPADDDSHVVYRRALSPSQPASGPSVPDSPGPAAGHLESFVHEDEPLAGDDGGVASRPASAPARSNGERNPDRAGAAQPGPRRASGENAARRTGPQRRTGSSRPRSAQAETAEGESMQPRVSGASAAVGLAEELALIRAAHEALRSDRRAVARRALAEHAARFPDGLLNEERRGLSLLLLCRTPPAAAATIALRDDFLRRAPNSVLAPQVRRACGLERGK